MIAFHFTPDSSIGTQRTLKTAEYLSSYGWDPIILTANSSAYDSTDNNVIIPENLAAHTYRTKAYDVQKHLSIKGKHFEWMKIIDRWTTWVPSAILKGGNLINEYQPDLIWSTSPIPSAHIIARSLSKKFNIPWIADYRDPFSYHHYPTSYIKSKLLKKIDRNTITHAKAVIFTTTKAKELYQAYFNLENSSKFHTVENGYDENNWEKLKSYTPLTLDPFNTKKFSLYYSGVLYPNGRNPEPLFEAIHHLHELNIINDDNFELIFQGAGNGEDYSSKLIQLKISNLVTFSNSVNYLDSLYFMTKADALVLIQDQIFNNQTPGKLYEYIRSGKPSIVITPKTSATAFTAKTHKLCDITSNSSEISNSLATIFNNIKISKPCNVSQYSRENKAKQMAEIFNQYIK